MTTQKQQIQPNTFFDVFATIEQNLGEPFEEAQLIDEVLVDYLIATKAGPEQRGTVQSTATAISDGLKLMSDSPGDAAGFLSSFEKLFVAIGTGDIDTSYRQRNALKGMLLEYLVNTDSDQQKRSNVAHLFEVLDNVLCLVQAALEDQGNSNN